ncbi:MAG: hypothetical protein DDT35_00240 [Firmicutes bacterium]|nr:hypothetical protein [Bacillota bacterium]
MPGLVLKEIVQRKLVIDFKDSSIAEVFSTFGIHRQRLIHIYGQSQLLLRRVFRSHLTSDLFEMSHWVSVFFLQNI